MRDRSLVVQLGERTLKSGPLMPSSDGRRPVNPAALWRAEARNVAGQVSSLALWSYETAGSMITPKVSSSRWGPIS